MATVKGSNAPDWGIPGTDESGVLTQRLSHTSRSDKKEARDRTGDVKAVAYYNNHAEINVEALGSTALALASVIELPEGMTIPSVSGSIYAEEITTERVNEEFVKTSIRGYAYAGITEPPPEIEE